MQFTFSKDFTISNVLSVEFSSTITTILSTTSSCENIQCAIFSSSFFAITMDDILVLLSIIFLQLIAHPQQKSLLNKKLTKNQKE